MTIALGDIAGLSRALTVSGYIHVSAAAHRDHLAAANVSIDASLSLLQSAWHDLPRDDYMGDGGRYRRRRHAALSLSGDDHTWQVRTGQPHYQSREFNTLNGDVARYYAPIRDEVLADSLFRAIIHLGHRLFREHTGIDDDHIELHQFRISPSTTEQGRPTPEGIHRDGVDLALMMLMDRRDVTGGMSRIYPGRHAAPIAEFTLADPLELAIVDDRRVFHDVSPLTPAAGTAPGYRDLLVATFSGALPPA